jgi:hydrogenase nickel incorporation protein HypA/HybF
MHELSIAMSVLDLVAEEAERRSNAVIKAVHVKLGPLSGVIKQALFSAFDLAREGTPQAACELVVEDVSVVMHCASCGVDYPAQSIQDLSCTKCGGINVTVISGRELEVSGLEIEA